MKHTTHFVSTRLVSLVLSLFLVFGTAASSLSAVTDLSITDQPASAAPALDGAAGSVASAADAASYGVAEGSLLAQPADDDVLDISIEDQIMETSKDVETDSIGTFAVAPVSNANDDLIHSIKREKEEVAPTGTTGALDSSKTYNVGVQNGNISYNLEFVNNTGIYNTSGWVVKQASTGKYLNADGFGQYIEKAEKYDVLSKAIVLEAEYDAGSNTYYFKGNYPDVRGGGTVEWYLYWRAEAQEAWLGHGKTGSGIPGDEVIDPTPSTYSVTVKQMVTNDGINFTETNDAATLSSSLADIAGLSADTPVTLTQSQTETQRETYTFLGWYVVGSYVETLASYNFTVTSDVTVEARYTTNPLVGSYKFTYNRRDIDVSGENTTWTKTVSVPLNGAELAGYSGNDNQPGVPTFLWTAEAQALFSKNPLVDAALALEGNAETGGENWQKDASVYKCDLVWDNLTATSQGSNVSYDATAHTVTIQATTTPYTFTLLYHTVSGGTATLRGTATGLEYGKAVTFNPIYSGSTEYAYVDYTVPSDGFSYWSADEAGNIPITTNLTYGMIMRGDYMHDDDDDRIVHIYAQYKSIPDKLWNPLIEEAKLTHTIDDNVDWVYLDYMTNYLSREGTVVQEMETKPEYGIVVAKYDSTLTTLTQEKMESVADKMIEKDKSSAYLDSGKTAIAYRFKYNDNEHISDFNRTLYTLKSNTSAAENKQFTAIAYIIVDETTYYSLINTDITVIDLV